MTPLYQTEVLWIFDQHLFDPILRIDPFHKKNIIVANGEFRIDTDQDLIV